MQVWKTVCVLSGVIVLTLSAGVILTACSKAQAQVEGEAVSEYAQSGTPLAAAKESEGVGAVLAGDATVALLYAIAITVGIACLSAGYAVGKVGAAALGAASEKPEIMGRALIFVGLAEGIAIYGLIIGIMLIMRI